MNDFDPITRFFNLNARSIPIYKMCLLFQSSHKIEQQNAEQTKLSLK